MNKIYALKDPISDDIRYIGKTKNDLKKRLYEHCTIRNLKEKNHKNNWIKSLLKLNHRPVIILIEEVVDSDWQEREIYWIEFYKNIGNNLTNGTNGGDGGNGAKRSKDYIERLIDIKRKNGTLTRSDECRKRISESHKGKKLSKDHSDKLTAYGEGKKKKIVQYDKDGNFIKIWDGIRMCARELNIKHEGIIRCLNNTQKYYKDYIWKYEIEDLKK
jgi:group I intron endonuclease